MSCFPCFQSQRSKKERDIPTHDGKKQKPADDHNTKNDANVDHSNIKSQNFTFRELATATKNFRQECLLGEGGFGRVYRGTLQGSGQMVAVKQLDRNGLQGNREFLVEVLMLSQLQHNNLVNLVGYCADGDQRLLVYEFMSGGSLEDHLLDIGPDQKPLDWTTRVKIAYGAAQGLEYLHDKANPPVIFRDLKSSNILLDDNFNPKLSDFGLAKLGPGDNKFHVSSRVMGTYGYCAPEYTRNGDLTLKSDVYSFGVVLLELITGRRAVDTTKPIDEQNLVSWAQPKFRDPKLFPDMADALLQKKFPEKALNQAVAVAAMCLQEEASVRPLISDVVTTLSFLLAIPDDPVPVSAPAPLPDTSPPSNEATRKSDAHSDSSDGRGDSDPESSESSDNERMESGKEEGLERKGSRVSSKSHSMSRDSSVSSSRHKKSSGSRRMSHKESVASTAYTSYKINSMSLSEEGSRRSISPSSSSSHGSITLGQSHSKRSHGGSVSSSSRKSSNGKYDKSLSRGHSKAYSRDGSSIRSRSSSHRGSSRKDGLQGDFMCSSRSSSGRESDHEEGEHILW